jgi:hypothetical protein
LKSLPAGNDRVLKSFADCTGNGQFLSFAGSKRLSRKPFLNGMFLNGKSLMDTVNPNPESRIWTLMARKLAGEASQDELIELEGLVQKSPHAHYVIEIVTLWWQLSEESGKEQAEQAVADLLARLEQENETFRSNKKGRIDNLCLV